MSGLVATDGVVPPVGRVRWGVIALLFVITSINYLDRNLLGVLKPTVQADLHFNESEFGDIVFAFSMAYAVGYAGMGWFTDKVGVRIGLAVAAMIWCVASAAHGLVSSVSGFVLARIALGLGEGGNFPTCIKTVATWFPVRDRAFATGVFNSGSNVGGLIAPLAAAFFTAYFGWQEAFLITGALGFVWVAVWLVLYRAPEENRDLTGGELAYIRSGPQLVADRRVPWLQLLRYPGCWAYLIPSILTGPVWLIYNNWLPSFLNQRFGVNLIALGLPLVAIYLMTDVGSILGGWVARPLISRGMSVTAARKLAMLACALCTTPVFFAAQTQSLWVATGLIGLAMAAHQGFSANLFTVISDTMPRSAIGSALGLGGFVSSIVGGFTAKFVGKLLDSTGNNYLLIFVGGASAYLLAVLAIHLILGRNRPTPTGAPVARPSAAV